MAKSKKDTLLYVVGPDGDVITRGSLPPPSTAHWRIRLKAKVVAAVESGLITRAEACARYRMSNEEYLEWLHKVQQSGLTDWAAKYADHVRPTKAAKPEGGDP